MFGSEVLDVAIGLIFVYLLLSFICSAGCELVESLVGRRAEFLKQGIQEMLSDDRAEGLVSAIYNHPLVSCLFKGDYKPGSTGNLPSYIPPRNFALALMDIVGIGGSRSGGSSAPGPDVQAGIAPPPEWVRATIQTNTSFNPNLSQALLTLAESAGYDPARIRQNIETWYNSSMDRVSGWFKRHSHFIVLTLGFALSLAINADTISITNGLATDKALRESLVSAAAEAAKTPPASSSAGAPGNSQAATDAAAAKFQANLQQIRSAGLPLGWNTIQNDPRHVPQGIREWLIKLLGIVLTTLAVSLGGPFWFDVLNRFMVVRSTVKPLEKSPEEASKA